jgi:hypothetical protein
MAVLAVDDEFVSQVIGVSFADRSRLVEVREAHDAFGQNFRSQLDRIGAELWVNGLAIEIGG